jgi:DNA/RNA endonuclease YhcR with UshA esterase domain
MNITPAAANVIAAPVVPPSGGGGGGGSSASSNANIRTEIFSPYTSTSILLNEIYPYPDEDEEEFIEIKNMTASTIGLAGWKIGDKVKNYTLSGSISAGEIKYYDKTITGISLNNSTAEEVKLLGPQGQVFGLLKYDSAKKGLSYSRDASSTWRWTAKITRGAENEFVEPDLNEEAQTSNKDETGLLWRVKYKPLIRQGEEILFDASRTLDPRGGRIQFVWNFDEGKILAGEKTSYVFASSGIHNILISATSSAGTIDEKKIKLNVYPMSEPLGAGVVISEIAPNESEGEEYIAVKNIGMASTSISKWKIIANDKVYEIPTDTILSAGDNAVYFKEITKLTLNNSGGEIELRRDDDVLVDVANYGKAKAGEKFVLARNEWMLTKPIAAVETKTMAKSAIKKTTTKNTGIKYAASSATAGIEGIRALDKGYYAQAKGIVAVLPGVFGTQFFYITDISSGIQIYQYKKDFPVLKVGDLVQVRGETAEANGAKRIKIKSKKDIVIISGNQMPSSTEMALEDVAPENAGALIKIAGEITEIKTNYFFLDNGAGEMKIYLKKNANIDKTKFKEGELAEVTGILEMYKTEMQLWPRSQDDIVITGESEELLKKEGSANNTPAGDTAEKYLTATAGGITTLVLGFLLKARGAAMRGLAGKGKELIAGLVKRNKV